MKSKLSGQWWAFKATLKAAHLAAMTDVAGSRLLQLMLAAHCDQTARNSFSTLPLLRIDLAAFYMDE